MPGKARASHSCPYPGGQRRQLHTVPPAESARHIKVDMARWPLIGAVDAACGGLDALERAAAGRQPDGA
jgi:hypothetical protein